MPAAMASFHITEEQYRALEAICKRLDVERLELFGSATTDAFAIERSDLDFLVTFISNVELGPWMAKYFDLQDALEKLFDRPVDLVFPSALKNPYFIRSVNETRRTVYERQIAEAA
jgi:predicted nucleotidyltransferase